MGKTEKGLKMNLVEISRTLGRGSRYTSSMDGDVLRVMNSESGSEYIVEAFGHSAQVRQAVRFECFDMAEDDLDNIYKLCSMVNERFSGCKIFIDKWGVLVTAADILEPVRDAGDFETVLNQVEFVSLAMVTLTDIAQSEGRMVTREEINDAMAVPSLQ